MSWWARPYEVLRQPESLTQEETGGPRVGSLCQRRPARVTGEDDTSDARSGSGIADGRLESGCGANHPPDTTQSRQCSVGAP